MKKTVLKPTKNINSYVNGDSTCLKHNTISNSTILSRGNNELSQSECDAGFNSGKSGIHSSRSIMLAEFTELLAVVPPTATREDYANAIIEENILGKQTYSCRRSTNQQLGVLYGLSTTIPVFRILRKLWDIDEQGRALIALFCAIARDAHLRSTTSTILSIPIGGELQRSAMISSITEITGTCLNQSSLNKVASNTSNSWTQSGHLKGGHKKIRTKVSQSSTAVAYAIWMGSLRGITGNTLLRTTWARLLDQTSDALFDQVLQAKKHGLLNVSAGGGIIEINPAPLEAKKEFITWGK